jgi:hypothetical protein
MRLAMWLAFIWVFYYGLLRLGFLIVLAHTGAPIVIGYAALVPLFGLPPIIVALEVRRWLKARRRPAATP